MRCTCSKREPCPIHPDKPLSPVVLGEEHCFVVKIYCYWPVGGTKEWHSTVAKDAIQVFKSDNVSSKNEAILIAAGKMTL